ncbi:(methyl)glyoxal oxidase [Ranunculus cassubicifolius]
MLGASDKNDASSTSSDSSSTSSDFSSDSSSTSSDALSDPSGKIYGTKSDDVETNFKGKWELHSANAGISGMHLMLLPNNKAIMFDSTVLGKSELLFPAGSCPLLNGVVDCYAHAAEYDIETAAVRPLRVHTDTWCSSGGVTVDGVLVQAGGYQGGGRVVRTLEMCDTCDFVEHGESLSRQRWYSTQQALPDGRFIVVGGRDDTARSYEIIPPIGVKTPLEQNFKLPFLVETTDTFPGAENNLYPHVHLSSDGNLFIFANYKSILYNYEKHQIVRRFPDLPGGARNYPGSAPSAVLPIKIPRDKNKKNVPVEVAICGGAPREAFQVREQKNQYLTGLKSCGRIKITDAKAKWKIEQMPGPRLMGDMLILPTGDLIIVNGAKKGSAGWEYAEDPYYSPVIYRPSKSKDKRFEELTPSKIARMYHSSAIVLPDGKILVAGSNTHARYNYTAKYPTELRVEKFSPPYLDPSLAMYAPTILSNYGQMILKYGQEFEVNVKLQVEAKPKDLKVTMYSPAFTTHGISMNQRLLVLPQIGVTGAGGSTTIKVRAPPSGAVAPPGYFMLFVVHRGVPSKSVWIRIKN